MGLNTVPGGQGGGVKEPYALGVGVAGTGEFGVCRVVVGEGAGA